MVVRHRRKRGCSRGTMPSMQSTHHASGSIATAARSGRISAVHMRYACSVPLKTSQYSGSCGRQRRIAPVRRASSCRVVSCESPCSSHASRRSSSAHDASIEPYSASVVSCTAAVPESASLSSAAVRRMGPKQWASAASCSPRLCSSEPASTVRVWCMLAGSLSRYKSSSASSRCLRGAFAAAPPVCAVLRISSNSRWNAFAGSKLDILEPAGRRQLCGL